MQFGFTGAAYTLDAAIHFVLHDCRDFAVAYYSDIFIHSKDVLLNISVIKLLCYLAKLGTKLRYGNLMSTPHDTYLPAKNLIRMFYIFIFISVGTMYPRF